MTNQLDQALSRTAGLLAEHIDAVFSSLEALRDLAQPILAAPTVSRNELTVLEPNVRQIIEDHHGFVDGAGLAIAPGLLSDAETWMQSWHRASGELGLTKHNLNPVSVSYYDYTHMSWFQRPLERDQPTLIGPYWDFGGTDTTIITASLPVPGYGGRTSVAAADLSIHQLEVAFLRTLGTQKQAIAVISETNKVVVSNSARWSAGSAVAGDAAPAIVVPTAKAESPWKILVLS